MANLKDPKCKRFFRMAEEFSLCVNIGERGYVLAEHHNERDTIFYYANYGRGKFGKPFESDYIMIESNIITDVQDYARSEVIFQALEDFYLIGFNTPDKNIKWDAELFTSKDKILINKKDKSFAICLHGNVSINDKQLKKYDYVEISSGIEYKLNIDKNGALGLFSVRN
jgi:hypothetical protein